MLLGKEAQPFIGFDMKIGRALKTCRTAKNLSLIQLSELAGLSQSYLSMIESGKREPSLTLLEKVVKSLELPMPIFLFLAAEKDELSGLDQETIDRLSAAVLDVVRS